MKRYTPNIVGEESVKSPFQNFQHSINSTGGNYAIYHVWLKPIYDRNKTIFGVV